MTDASVAVALAAVAFASEAVLLHLLYLSILMQMDGSWFDGWW